MSKFAPFAALVVAASVVGCSSSVSSSNGGGLTNRVQPDLKGTIFTIVFENEAATSVFPNAPFFSQLAQQYGQATNYTSSTHPSLPNYIMLTAGATDGIINDNDPTGAPALGTHENIAYQLDTAGIPWRAYMESMGTPCKMESSGDYSAHHDPFLYFTDVTQNACADRVVDFDQNFDADLASGAYKYMWITPNMCDDMHNCPASTSDAWLKNVVTKIQASDAYKNGGAIFILFDEGSMRIMGATAQLATVVVSENLVHPGYATDTPFDHRSYLATIEDIFGLERLSTTRSATSMDEFFKLVQPASPTERKAVSPSELQLR